MPTVVFKKIIKPGRFKRRAATNILLGAVRSAGNEIKKDFEKTTRSWEHKPRFEVVWSVKFGGPEVLVGTDDAQYGYVNDGTFVGTGHYIYPTNASRLSWQVNFSPKTSPGVIDSVGGGKFGPTTVRPWTWNPGIEPRKFDEAIEKIWTTKFNRRMEEAMRRATAATGHQI